MALTTWISLVKWTGSNTALISSQPLPSRPMLGQSIYVDMTVCLTISSHTCQLINSIQSTKNIYNLLQYSQKPRVLIIIIINIGGFSGGTLASLLGIIDRKQYNMPKVPLDHYKTLPGNQEPHAVESQFLGPYFINYCSTYKQFVMFSIMGSCNFSVIRRSNSMLGYSLQSPKSTLLYKESMVPEGLLMSLYTYSLLVFTSTCLLFSPTRYLLTKFLLPKPGNHHHYNYNHYNYNNNNNNRTRTK